MVQDITKMKWHYIHTRRRSPWFVYLWWQGLSTKTVNIEEFDYQISHCGQADHKVLIDDADWETKRRALLKRLEQYPLFLSHAIDTAYHEHKKFTRFCRKIYSLRNVTRLSNQQIAHVLEKYRDHVFHCAAYSILPLYVEDDISLEIRERLSAMSNNIDRDYNIVMTPVKDGTDTLEKEAFVKLVIKAQRITSSAVQRLISQHQFNFSWLKNVGHYGEFFSLEYYEERLGKTTANVAGIALRKIRHERQERKRQFRGLLWQCRKDTRLVALMRTMNEAIYYRSFRSEQFYQSNKYLSVLLKEAASRIGLPNPTDIFYFTVPEVVKFLAGHATPDLASLERRKLAFIFITDYEDHTWYEGAEAKNLAEQIAIGSATADEVKGQIAFPGKVRGKVKIVLSPQDFHKVEAGDILVALSTQPNYVPILTKAAAFVTEEGGVLCHASMVAREMKKPCVIGTKVATKVFHDGDMVEVDAERGVVKKIS